MRPRVVTPKRGCCGTPAIHCAIKLFVTAMRNLLKRFLHRTLFSVIKCFHFLREGVQVVSATVHRLFSDGMFDPETLHAMGEACEHACPTIPDVHQREAIARAILLAARNRQRNADALHEAAPDDLNVSSNRL